MSRSNARTSTGGVHPGEDRVRPGGTVYRTVEALKFEEFQGFKTVTESKMTDTKMGGHTVLSYPKTEYDVGLPEDIFAERYLRRAPREYLD